jgi:DNA adenine methylase
MSNPVESKVPLLPFLKWAGGKSRLIHQYKDYFPKTEFKSYYEPFLGGGSVFFYLQSNFQFNLAVLTDINPDLVETYCCVRDNVVELISLLKEHQDKHNNDRSENHNYYYEVRKCRYTEPIQRAARLIYLNRTCFNGLYRENSNGEFNVPIGKYKNPKICNPTLLYSASAALKSAKIEVRHFEEIQDYAKTNDDFVYFDPPYHPRSKTSYFTAYSRHSFNEKDQRKLRDIFASLAVQGVKVMLSNSDSDFIQKLYRDPKAFKDGKLPEIHRISASRVINSKVNERGRISEVLITSY